ncbi:uncharacterized protein ACRADG_006676 [Cochliomyia hominivorax]
MISLRYFILILLVGAQFTSTLTQEPEEAEPIDENPEAPAGGEEDIVEETAAPEPGEETTEAGAGDETTTPASTPAPNNVTPPPKCKACYRNQNGMCRTFDVACSKIGKNLRDNRNIVWRMSPGGCAQRKANEVKVCSSDCPRFKNAICLPASTPVCGYSANRKMCRLYPSLCHLKKNACNNPLIGDWRVARMARCNGLRVGARAVPC